MAGILANNLIVRQGQTEKTKAIWWNLAPLISLNFFDFSEASIIFCEYVEDLANFLLRLKGPHSVDDSHRKDQDKEDSQRSNHYKLKS